MVTERWLPVDGFPGYEVSDAGRVRSWRTGPGRLADEPHPIRPNMRSTGYLVVRLWRNGKVKNLRLHRLVTNAFLGPLPEGMQTRHLDGNTLNNALSNLAYGTPTENRIDRIRHGTDHNLNKTHCPYGHAYDEQNTYVPPDGSRICRACMRVREANRPRRDRSHRYAKTSVRQVTP